MRANIEQAEERIAQELRSIKEKRPAVTCGECDFENAIHKPSNYHNGVKAWFCPRCNNEFDKDDLFNNEVTETINRLCGGNVYSNSLQSYT